MLPFFLTNPIGRAIGGTLAVFTLIVLCALGFKWWLAAHDKAVLEGYVLLSEKTTAEAKAAELERQRNAASQALEEARKRQAADDTAQLAKDAQTEIEIADYEKKLSAANRSCLVDDADRLWLQSH